MMVIILEEGWKERKGNGISGEIFDAAKMLVLMLLLLLLLLMLMLMLMLLDASAAAVVVSASWFWAPWLMLVFLLPFRFDWILFSLCPHPEPPGGQGTGVEGSAPGEPREPKTGAWCWCCFRCCWWLWWRWSCWWRANECQFVVLTAPNRCDFFNTLLTAIKIN